MTISDQFKTVKNNWLLIVIVFVLLIAFSGIGSIFQITSQSLNSISSDEMYRGVTGSYAKSAPGMYTDNFAPTEADRKITKTSSLGVEVARGDFASSENTLKSIATSSGSIILNQNVNAYGSGKNTYSSGSYMLKVDVKKYDAVVTQLKDIGDVKSFNENADDITGSYTDTNIEIDVETKRLERYTQMYNEATIVQDKITLNDRMFDEERTIQYLKDSLKNMDQRVDYTTVYVSITEKQPEYLNIAFAKFSDLIRTLVGSMNSVLYLLFAVLPYAVIAGIIFLIVRVVRKH